MNQQFQNSLLILREKNIDKIPILSKFSFLYKIVDEKTTIDIEAVKQHQYDVFRSARVPLLSKLDIEYMKADENGDANLKQEIAAKKQVLRDVTNIELPNDFLELSQFWPECLK